jgi:hypothetical protein
MLKNSARNSKRLVSEIGNCLTREVSHSVYPGPTMSLRGASPNVPWTMFGPKAHVLNSVPGTQCVLLGLPMMVGRAHWKPTKPPQVVLETGTMSVAV